MKAIRSHLRLSLKLMMFSFCDSEISAASSFLELVLLEGCEVLEQNIIFMRKLKYGKLRGPAQGAGGSEVNFHFLVIYDRRECQLPGTLYGMKKYCS